MIREQKLTILDIVMLKLIINSLGLVTTIQERIEFVEKLQILATNRYNIDGDSR